jgi:hypothetical protein
MAITTTNVVGPIVMPDGAKPAGAVVVFQPSNFDVQAGVAVISKGAKSYSLDENADFSADLAPTDAGENGITYNVSLVYNVDGITGPVSMTDNFGPIGIPSGGTVKLNSLVQQPITTPTPPDVLALALAAQAGATAASLQTADDRAAVEGIAEDFGTVDDAISAAQTAQAGSEAALADTIVARDTVIDEIATDYKPNDAAALAAITGMVAGQTALVRNTMHIWEYSGTEWVDTGISLIALKADKSAVAEMIIPSDGVSGNMLDKNGFKMGSISPTEGVEFIFGGLSKTTLENEVFAFREGNPNELQDLDVNGFLLDYSTDQATSSATVGRDHANIAASNYIKSQTQQVQRYTCDYCGHGAYGQSFSIGSESRAQLSMVAVLGNLMMGDSVKPLSTTDEAWVQRGTAVFTPMVATDTAYYGETALEGDANAFKKLMSNYFMSPQLSQAIVSFAAGVGGKNIDELSKGATPDYYNKYLDAIALLKSIATTEGGTSCLTSMQVMMSQSGNGEVLSTYEPKLRSMIENLQADAMAEFGQTEPPAIYLLQPGSNYTSDAGDFGVHMAHIAVQDMQGVYLVGPQYGYPREGAGHWNANSYRWYAAQNAKVRYRTQVLGQGWHPLEPRQAEYTEGAVFCDFLVPCAPLQFQDTWVGNPTVLTDYETKGFTLTDSSGEVEILSVEIYGETSVKITPAAPLDGNAYLWYGDTSHGGAGNLVDSDTWLHPYEWETVPVVNGNNGENIPELVGEKYSGANRCVQFRIEIKGV